MNVEIVIMQKEKSMKTNVFNTCTDPELKTIYKEILSGREEGLRPKIIDPYIEKVREKYPLTFAEGWRYAEKEFWDEVGERFFLKVPNEHPIPKQCTIYEAVKKAKSQEEMAEILSNICWTCSDCSSDGREECIECISNQLDVPIRVVS